MVERHHLQTRFWDCDRAPCMRIAMATRDRPCDVTTTSTDVSQRVMDMAWCNRTRKSRHRASSAELDTQRRRTSSSALGMLSKSFPTSKSERSCPKRTTRRADVSYTMEREEKDRHHVENSPLSEIGGRRGARGSSETIGCKQHRISLDSFCSLFFIHLVHYDLLNGEPFEYVSSLMSIISSTVKDDKQ